MLGEKQMYLLDTISIANPYKVILIKLTAMLKAFARVGCTMKVSQLAKTIYKIQMYLKSRGL